jgi:UDP-glucose 4-epimerase
MKKILITGGAGYIGQHLATYLSTFLTSKDYIVDVMDRKPSNGEKTTYRRHIQQDILDTKRIDDEYDTIIHLAALVQVGGGQMAAMDYYRTNVVGTMNMLEKVDFNNFIFASTCQATEAHVYGHTKHIAEGIVRQYCALNNKKHTIFRFGNVIGTEGYAPTNTDGLLYNLIKAKETGLFNLYGNDYNTADGTAERDYIHVMEVCYAIEKAINRASCVPAAEIQPVFEYLGRAMPVSVSQCIEAFKKINKCDFEVVVKPRRFGDIAKSKTQIVSPYMPQNIYTLEQLMKI